MPKFWKATARTAAAAFGLLLAYSTYVALTDPDIRAAREERERATAAEAERQRLQWESEAPAREAAAREAEEAARQAAAMAERRRAEREAAAQAEREQREARDLANRLDHGAQYVAETSLRASLRDPDSLQLEDVMVVRGRRTQDRAVCGKFNSRNAYGGYAGFQLFIYRVSDLSEKPDGTLLYRSTRITPSERAVLQHCVPGFAPLN